MENDGALAALLLTIVPIPSVRCVFCLIAPRPWSFCGPVFPFTSWEAISPWLVGWLGLLGPRLRYDGGSAECVALPVWVRWVRVVRADVTVCAMSFCVAVAVEICEASYGGGADGCGSISEYPGRAFADRWSMNSWSARCGGSLLERLEHLLQ